MFETMLIVDDYDLERELFIELMQDNFTILEARNGKECLDVMESCRGNIDVVLLDLMMPEMDGFSVLEKRQELDYFRDVPTIVLTSSGAVDDQVKAFSLGASDFISKPIIPDIAISRVNNVLTSRRRLMSIIRETEEFKTKSEMDMMTDLYNKVTSEEKINEELQMFPEEQHAMMILDIDNFKAVNDIEGHQVGDHTIRIIADLISTHFRRSDIVGRIGGDEFIVLMSKISSKEIARQKGKDIVRIMKYKPNLTIPANVSISIGLAFSEKKLTDYHSLFQKADEALYISKERGKARMTEYGAVEVENLVDERANIVLCCRTRNICSTVESVVPKNYRFQDSVDIEELKVKLSNMKNKVRMVYIDVSDTMDEGASIWMKAKEMQELEGVKVVALCKEGNMEQYREAVLGGIAKDVLTVPLNVDQLKRRMEQLLKEK